MESVKRAPEEKLFWLRDLDLGVCLEPPIPYDEQYWLEYIARSGTPMGETLTRIRLDIVNRYVHPSDELVDIGIGCGQFIRWRGQNTYGYDINPLAINWLHTRQLLRDPLQARVPNASFWDSLEHIEEPSKILDRVTSFVFISMPIYRDREHVLASKHYKPGEHFWYFTTDGLVRFMRGLGFVSIARSDAETEAGREDIGSFVFRRF